MISCGTNVHIMKSPRVHSPEPVEKPRRTKGIGGTSEFQRERINASAARWIRPPRPRYDGADPNRGQLLSSGSGYGRLALRMSLTSFTERREVRERLKPFRPPPPRTIQVPLKVARRSVRPDLIGTAFDYLLRFELSRRAPHATWRRWASEVATLLHPKTLAMLRDDIRGFAAGHPEFDLNCIVRCVENDSSGGLKCDGLVIEVDGEGFSATISRPKSTIIFNLSPEELFFFQRSTAIIEEARRAVNSPTPLGLGAHAVRLAKLDMILRAGMLDTTFESADANDVAELLELVAVVPFDQLIGPVMLLNPTFGEASEIVGGADADLIVNGMLVDFKTTKEAYTDPLFLDQLLGYFLLARRAHRNDGAFPEINLVGLYFSRYGYLWRHDVSHWTGRADFAELEAWFFNHAKAIRAK